jgi:hypothetical protein
MVNKFSWFGISLILVGAAMLLDRLDVLTFGWKPVLWALVTIFGIVKATSGFAREKRGNVFWGTFFFLFGAYSLLHNLDLIDVRSYMVFPMVLLIVGFSILMTYFSSPKEWHLLIPALFLVGTGGVMVLAELGYFYRYDVVETVRLYWPVGLILFGVALVLRRRSTHLQV